MEALKLDLLDLEDSGRVTPVPPFDPATYARESETDLVAVVAREGGAPPPPTPRAPSAPDAAPRDSSVRLTTSFQSRLEAFARRAALLSTALRIGELAPEEAALALLRELEALERAPLVGPLAESARVVASSLRDVIQELSGIALESPPRPRRIVVLDANAETAAAAALALEARGQTAVLATNVDDLYYAREEGRVDAIFVAIDLPEAELCLPFCRTLRDVVQDQGVPVVIYGRAPHASLRFLALHAGADRALRIGGRFHDVLEATARILETLPPARPPR